jgi:hypothetical protein
VSVVRIHLVRFTLVRVTLVTVPMVKIPLVCTHDSLSSTFPKLRFLQFMFSVLSSSSSLRRFQLHFRFNDIAFTSVFHVVVHSKSRTPTFARFIGSVPTRYDPDRQTFHRVILSMLLAESQLI